MYLLFQPCFEHRCIPYTFDLDRFDDRASAANDHMELVQLLGKDAHALIALHERNAGKGIQDAAPQTADAADAETSRTSRSIKMEDVADPAYGPHQGALLLDELQSCCMLRLSAFSCF